MPHEKAMEPRQNKQLTVLALLIFFLFHSFAVAQQSSPSRMLRLPGNLHPLAVRSQDQGLLPAGQQMKLQIHFAPSTTQRMALTKLLIDQRNTSSADFQRWLKPQDFGSRFGIAGADAEKIEAWLAGQGFSQIALSPSRMAISFTGSASQVGSAFRTSIHRVVSNGVPHFTNISDISMPAALAPLVQRVSGLNDFHPVPLNIRLGRKLRPAQTSGPGAYDLAPGDIATIYDIQALYNAGIDGTGMKAVVVGQSDINLSDIQAYRNAFNLPAKTPNVVLVPTSSDPGFGTTDQTESDLDIEVLGAVARNADITFVNSTDVLDSLQYAIDQDIAPVISLSYAGCEYIGETWDNQAASTQLLAQQANAQGITIVGAAGDSGAAACDSSAATAASFGETVSWPVDVPEVTGVGGTSFVTPFDTYFGAANDQYGGSLKSYVPEVTWNETSAGINISGTGGGASLIYSKPSWQQGPGVPADGARDVPDVALFSINNIGEGLGYLICTAGDCTSGPPDNLHSGAAVGGTSASTPVFAGIVTLLNHFISSNGTTATAGMGNINPNLYLLAANTSDVFHDVTQGDNIVTCVVGTPSCATGTFGYSAGPGYDQATGLGSVDVFNLLHEWAKHTQTGTKITLTASQSPVVSGSNLGLTLTAKVAVQAGSAIPSGSVSFYTYIPSLGNPASVLANAVVDATGTAIIHLNNLDTNVTMIYAEFSGTMDFSQSFAGPLSVLLPSSIALVPTPTAANWGDPVTLTATVSAGSDPGGTVNFYTGSALVGAAPVVGQTATMTVSNLPTGLDSITASWLPGANSQYGPSTSPAIQIQITVEGTQTSLSSSSTQSTRGQAVTFTATVKSASGTGTPTGSVSFMLSQTVLGTGTLANGIASYSTSGLAVGSNDVYAIYAGDSNYTSSTSPSASVTVSAAPTTTSLSASSTQTSYGDSVTLTAAMTTASGSFTPTGSVTFYNQSAILGTANVTNGKAVITLSALPVGKANITASYSGDSNVGASTAAPITITVARIVTSISLSTSFTQTTQAGQIILSATITPGTGTGSPTGAITFVSGTSTLGAASLTGKTATLPASGLAVGNDVIIASYAGDSAYAPSQSNSVTVTVSAAPITATTTLAASASQIDQGDSVNLVATIQSPAGSALPTGTMQFLMGTTPVGSVVVTAGTATLTTTSLPVGADSITASYSGDTIFAPSASKAVVVTVLQPDFTISAAPASLSVTGGQAAQTVLSIVPSNGLSNPPTLACSGLPAGSACTFGASVTKSDGSFSIPLSIATVALASAVRPGAGDGYLFALIPFILFLTKRRKTFLKTISLMLILGVAVVMTTLTGCGGGQSSATAPPHSQTSIITVTAQSSSGATHTATLTLTVN